MATADIRKVNTEEMKLSQLVLRCIKAGGADEQRKRLNSLFYTLSEAWVWLPVIKLKAEDGGKYSYTDKKRGNIVTRERGTKILSDRLKTPDGKIFLPVFTTMELAPSDYREKFSWCREPFVQCCLFVNKNESCSGIVLNPFAHNMEISRKILSVYMGKYPKEKKPE